MVLVEIADLIPLAIARVTHVVILHEREGRRCLSITLEGFEGHNLQRGLQGSSSPRPLTHQLLGSMFQALDCELEEVRIERWKRETFYATIQLRKGCDVIVLDSRPGDALSLAVLAAKPIYVAEEVFAEAGRPYPQEAIRWRTQRVR